MKKSSILIFVLMLAFLSVKAQEEETRGHHKGDGLFMSMALGGSYLSIIDKISNWEIDQMEMKGAAVAFDFNLGGVIKENLILHGDMIVVSSSSVKITADGEDLGTLSGDNSVAMVMLGAGSTYYFMPQNIFISGVLGIGGFSITEGNTTSNTQKGPGLYLKIGKEWWVSKDWDLGVSIGLNYIHVKNDVDEMTEKLSGTSIGISFNATFN